MENSIIGHCEFIDYDQEHIMDFDYSDTSPNVQQSFATPLCALLKAATYLESQTDSLTQVNNTVVLKEEKNEDHHTAPAEQLMTSHATDTNMILQSSTIFECNCNATFKTKTQRAQHIMQTHLDCAKHTCKLCAHRFVVKDIKQYKYHLGSCALKDFDTLIKDIEKKYFEKINCITLNCCNKSFNTYKHFEKHISQKHYVGSKFQCPFATCKKTSARCSEITKHVYSHMDATLNSCSVKGCHKNNPTYQTLKQHIISEHEMDASNTNQTVFQA